MVVNLEENEIESLLYAISVADDEGYGPEEFGKGDWAPLYKKLRECLNS